MLAWLKQYFYLEENIALKQLVQLSEGSFADLSYV